MKLYFPVHPKLLITVSLFTLGIGCVSPVPESRTGSNQARNPLSDDSDKFEALDDELSDLDETPDQEEDKVDPTSTATPPLGQKLDFKVVSPLSSDSTKPDPAAPLALQTIFGNSVTKIQVPIAPKRVFVGRNLTPSLQLWPFLIFSDHYDIDPIVSANYFYEVIDSKNQTHTVQKPAPVTPDYGNKLWYVSTEELNQALSRAAFTTTLSDTHLLRLDLVLSSGSRKLLDVRFKMKSQ